MNKLILCSVVVLLMSCSDGCKKAEELPVVITEAGEEITKDDWRYDHETFVPEVSTGPVGQGLDVDSLIERKGHILENICTIISQKQIADALGKTVQEIQLRNASPPSVQATQRSCFIKWSDFEVPNAGLFFQMIINPFEELEYADYITIHVESFRSKGEGEAGAPAHKFKKFEGFGDDGSYSTQNGKYTWRIGNKVAFLIAFNTAHGPKDQYRIASTLARAITENYIK